LSVGHSIKFSYMSAANVHYITGKVFGSWVRESGLQAGEQIRLRRDDGRVVIQRVPLGPKARHAHALLCYNEAQSTLPYHNKPACLTQLRTELAMRPTSRTASFLNTSGDLALAVAGAPAFHGQELASPPAPEALEALDALVAAAGYAGTHGTPAIQAALAGATAAGLAADGLGRQLSFGLGSCLPPALPKRRRTMPIEGSSAAELLIMQQERQLILSRRCTADIGHPSAGQPLASSAVGAGSFLDGWQPSDPHVLMYQAISQVHAAPVATEPGAFAADCFYPASVAYNNDLEAPNHVQILAAHSWSAEEQASLQRFR
jgi:hypothetical protein